MNDDNILEQIRKALIEGVGAYPEDTDDPKVLRYPATDDVNQMVMTEVRLTSTEDSFYQTIQVWHQDGNDPFQKVAEFSYIMDVEAMASFIQQFAML